MNMISFFTFIKKLHHVGSHRITITTNRISVKYFTMGCLSCKNCNNRCYSKLFDVKYRSNGNILYKSKMIDY